MDGGSQEIEKGEIERLKEWKHEASLALSALQAQVKSLCNEIESIKHNLEHKDEEIKALRRILGVSTTELTTSPQRKSRSQIMLGMPRVPPPWSEADKPQANTSNGSPSFVNHLSVEQFNIGQHKKINAEMNVIVPDLNGSTYEEVRSPHTFSLQMASLQTFAPNEGITTATYPPPFSLDPPDARSSTQEVADATEAAADSAEVAEREKVPNDPETPEVNPQSPAALSSDIYASSSDVVKTYASEDAEKKGDEKNENVEEESKRADTTNGNQEDNENGKSIETSDTQPTQAEEISSPTLPTTELTKSAETSNPLVSEAEAEKGKEELPTPALPLDQPTQPAEVNRDEEQVQEEMEDIDRTDSPTPPSSAEVSPTSSGELVIEEIPPPPELEEKENEKGSERVVTPIVPRRGDLRPRSLINKPHLKLSIEIPSSAFSSPRFSAPGSPTILASPHIPSAPTSTPVSTPLSTPDVTPVSTPTNAPSTPKLHLTRPKLPTRDEIKAKSFTLKRTPQPTIKRNASESLANVWIDPESPRSPPPPSPSTNPTDINELYAQFHSTSSDAESDTESPHRLQVSISEERICSPENSDSEDSFLQIKRKYSSATIDSDSLRRYEQDARRVILVQKVIRGWIHRRRLEKIRKRTEATKELLTTELGYAKCLDLMIHHYVKPLRTNSTSPNAYILPSQVDEIFSTIEDIKQSSAMLLSDLDTLMKSWNYFSLVGPVMLLNMEMLQPHMPFVVNYERSQQVLATCSKNKEFSAFLRRRMTSAELDYKTLDDFLILPVQRIPRYIMLLEAIYKYTPPTHPDREGVRKAAQQMRSLAEKINKRKAAVAKLVEFCSCIKGYEGEPIVQEARYLVREGNVMNEKRRPRYVALMNDLLVVCKPPEPPKSKKDPPKKTYKYVAQLKLDGSTNLQVRPFGAANSLGVTPYIIVLKNSHTTITLTTGTEDGKGWTKDVHSVLETLRKKK